MTTPLHNGIIIYHGPSLIDGEPIVAVLTGLTRRSKNPKTADELQTYIVREDIHPKVAGSIGADKSVCGDCMHRPTNGGSCYVWPLIGKAPSSIWRAYHRGAYPVASEHELREIAASGIPVRAGSYGDPAAIPVEIWQALGVATGYTHQWRQTQALAAYAMASVDSVQEAKEAKEAGWRYFRVRPEGAPLISGEIDCPSKKGVTCDNCRLCGGLQRKAKSISIEAHGVGAKKFTGRRLAVVA